MTEQKSGRSSQPSHGVPRRTISGERIRVARRIRDVPAPEITLGFSDEEPPTASVPKPILNMLLRSMLSQDAAATAPGASHGPSNVRVPADPEIQISVQPVSEEPPPKEASEQPPQEREIVSKRRHSTRGLWIAVSVILAGTAGYAALRFAESRLPEHERAPAPALAHEPARDAGVPSLQPAELQPLDSSLPVAAMPLHTAIDPNAATSLLSIDGSEATAPSCDDLVGNAPTTGAHSFRDHLRAARSAIGEMPVRRRSAPA